MNTSIGVVGATGTVGSELIKILSTKKNISIHAFVRDIEKAKRMNLDHVQLRQFDFSALDQNVFNGIDRIFWLVPANEVLEKEWLDIIKASSIKHIVLLSSIFPDIFEMRASEILIEKSEIPYAILRPNTFMQNFNTDEKNSITKNNAFYYPADLGKTSFIDVRDIAEVAATILLSDDHTNKIYTLTGDESLNYYQIAEILSKVCNRAIRYVDTWSHPEYENHDFKNESVWQAFFAGVRQGLFGEISNDLSLLLKRPAIKFKKYANDYWSAS